MPGLFRRLVGMASKGAAPLPPFTIELPGGWVGGYGPTAFVDALVDHARAHPDNQDRAYELMGTAAGAEGVLFMAGAIRGPMAGLTVIADALQPGGVLSLDDELDAWVEGKMEVLAADDGVVGDPLMSTVEQPYAGRELRWSQRFEGGPPMASVSYCYATTGQVWTLRFDQFDPETGSAPALEATFRAIALSFRVIQPGTEPEESRD
jgi:hypothetical protein